MVDVAQVQAHSRFFDHLVDLIPARFYHDEQEHLDMKSLKKAERLAAKEEFKQKAKENKRTKLDPDAAVTALEQQKRQHASTGAEEDGEEQQQQAGPSASLNVGQKLSREELLERLRQKIQESRAQRGQKEGPKEGGQQQQDKKAGEKGANNNNKKGAKPDKKEVAAKAKEWREKTLEENAKAKQQQQQQQAGAKRKAGQQEGGPAGKAAKTGAGQAAGGAKAAAAAKPEANADGDFQFARLEFEEGRPHSKPGGKGGKPQSKEALLAAAEAKRKEQAEAGATDEGKVRVVTDAWRTALARAQGEKVLDDPKLLRKSLKKEAKRKEKSAKAWQERKAAQADQQAAKQQKRKDNLQARVTAKVEAKKAKREKKLLRAGFEGRKAGFIGDKGKGGAAK